MKITNELIASFNPCKNRHDNYLEHYKGQEFEFIDFLELAKISYADKIWVARRVLTKNQVVHWALLCAQSVLHVFENKHRNDKRPRECIEYLISIKDYSNITDDQQVEIRRVRAAAAAVYAADDAVYDDAVYDDAVYAANAADAADAVVYAAVYAANAAAADDDAAYAYAYAAVYAALYAAAYADDSCESQSQLNLEFLKVASVL